MTTGIIIQARVSSSRLPNKTFLKINNKYSIEYVVEACLNSKNADKVCLAVPHDEKPLFVKNLAEKYPTLFIVGGAKNDLVNRFWKTSNLLSLNSIVRITGDCLCLHREMIDTTINFYKHNSFDYVSNFALQNSSSSSDANNHASETFLSDGHSVEVFSFGALKRAYRSVKDDYDKEHATTWIKRNLNCGLYKGAEVVVSDGKFSLDEEKDIETIEAYLTLKKKGYICVSAI